MTTCTLSVNELFETETAAMLVQISSRFNSRISLQFDNKAANAKSIMGVISLGIAKEQPITITAEGNDEHLALQALNDFFSTLQSL